MTEHGLRAQPPGRPQFRQRIFRNEYRGLGNCRLSQTLRGFKVAPLRWIKRLPQIEPKKGAKPFRTSIHLFAKDRLGPIEVFAHPGVLRALPWEHPGGVTL